MSIKEKLELWKKDRASAASSAKQIKGAPGAGSLRSKVQKAAKSTIFESSNNRRSACNDRNVVKAGKKKIGANTPIGKLKARLRVVETKSSSSNKENVTSEYNKNLFGSDDDDDSDNKTTDTSSNKKTAITEVHKIINIKMEEAESLAKKFGSHVARAYMEELPKDQECSHLGLLSKAVYWLTWIKIEQTAHEWERVEQLFMRAEPLVLSNVDKRIIAAAYETFRQQADSLLEEKMNSIATTKSTPVVQSFVPQVAKKSDVTSKRKLEAISDEDKDELSSKSSSTTHSTFMEVNVSNTRRKFENGISHTSMEPQSTSIEAGTVNVKRLSQNLIATMGQPPKLGRALAGAVALPGMPTAPLSRTQSMRNNNPVPTVEERSKCDDLSHYLGINNDADEEEDEEAPPNRQEPPNGQEGATVHFESIAPSKKVKEFQPKKSRSRGPVRLTAQAVDVGSESEGEAEDENEKEIVEEVQVENSKATRKSPSRKAPVPKKSPRTSKSKAVEALPSRKTRSGVCFADMSYNTPGKKSVGGKKGNSKKVKVTPFKPTYDEIVLSSPESVVDE